VSLTVSAPATRKTVVVLGRSASGLALPPSDGVDGYVVLTLGWPVTGPQRAVLDAAESAARAAGVVFDAHLLASPDDLLPLVGAADRVLVDANPRESRRIRRTLDRR
jgi:hypothetical protein